MKYLKQFLWLVPFLCFLFGYYLVSWFMAGETIKVPQFSGKRLQEAVSILVPYKLNLRILDEVEEPAVAEGTILNQRPIAGKKIKVFQSIGVVVAKKPKPILAPDFVSGLVENAQSFAEQNKFRLKNYFFYTNKYPLNWCIAQVPISGQPIINKSMLIYASAGQVPFRIMPNILGKSLKEVYAFFSSYNADIKIFPREYNEHTDCDSCKIISQKPIPGSLVNLDKPFRLSLTVDHR